PYHYRRVEAPVLPPVLVPRYSDFPLNNSNRPVPIPSNFGAFPFRASNMPINVTYNSDNDSFCPPSSTMTSSPPPPYSNGPTSPFMSNISSMMVDSPPPAYSPISIEITPDVQPVSYQEAPKWCSIAYYELSSRVGEMFHAQYSWVVID